MKTLTILTEAEHDRALMVGMEWLGIAPELAAQIIGERWPMVGDFALAEIEGRGLKLTLADLDDFLHAHFERTHFDDDTPIHANAIGWNRRIVGEAIEWAQANGRGTPAGLPPKPQPVDTIPAMIDLLRSGRILDRMRGALLLSRRLASGLRDAGSTVEQAAGISPSFVSLMSGVVAGDPEALAEMERQLSTLPSHVRAKLEQDSPWN